MTSLSKANPYRRVIVNFERYHTVAGAAEVQYELRDVDGKTYVMPKEWDQTACKILATKYMRRAGVPKTLTKINEGYEYMPVWLRPSTALNKDHTAGETDARQVFHRLAGCWTFWGWQMGYFDDHESAKTFYDELVFLLATQRFAPNSPQWFNTGLNWAYGIEGPGAGQYACTFEKRGSVHVARTVCEVQEQTYIRPAPSACFILNVEDSLLDKDGIYETLEREARIFKFGGGAGANFSKLRGKNEPLAGGGVSSGVMSFLDVFDAGGGAIKSGGVTRRAAKMVVLNCDHPDIEKFVTWKAEEEYRVGCMLAGDALIRNTFEHTDAVIGDPETLIPAGLLRRKELGDEAGIKPQWPEKPYSASFEGDDSAYARAGGQNSNNSIRVTDGFMEAVESGGDWNLYNRTDGTVSKTIPARLLWDKIVNSCWTSGDPGIQFDTVTNEWHTCPADGNINASNPCSEFVFLDDTACNLASIRLTAYSNGPNHFDAWNFGHDVRLITTMLDITVSMAAYPSKTIAENSIKYRTLGLGFADLGALLMRNGIAYGSPESLTLAAAISTYMTLKAYETSHELACDLEVCQGWLNNPGAFRRVIGNHVHYGKRILNRVSNPIPGIVNYPIGFASVQVPTNLASALSIVSDRVSEILAHGGNGFRNSQVTLLAPTGTIGLLMGCDTTGIEPDFSLIKMKQLVGGGYIRIVNNSLPRGLAALGYSPGETRKIVEHVFGTRRIPDSLEQALRDMNSYQFVADVIQDKIEKCQDLREVFEDSKAFLYEAVGKIDTKENFEKVIDAWNTEVYGHGDVEGYEFRENWHSKVFLCANPASPGGMCLSPYNHLDMMAACQPGLSGAISKTVNFPADATPEDVSSALMYAWKARVKCVAFYIDGQKLSQPLQTVGTGNKAKRKPKTLRAVLSEEDREKLKEEIRREYETPGAVRQLVFEPGEFEIKDVKYREPGEVVEPISGVREALPNRRAGYTQKFRIAGQTFYLRTGEYPDGRLGEIFLDTAMDGAAFKALGNALAIAVSLGLQHGVPLQEYVDAFVGQRFEPSGVIQGHDRLRMASSFLDAIFRDLAIEYLGADEMAHVQTPASKPEPEERPQTFAAETDPEKPKVQGKATGQLCPQCKNFSIRRTGSCLMCDRCFFSSGCS